MSEDALDVNYIIKQRWTECNQSGLEDEKIESGFSCPWWFDGWTCWPKTAAGETANRSCPFFVEGFEPELFVYFKCDDDGAWHFHEIHNKTWVNYTTCVNTNDLSFRTAIIIIHSIGYGTSLIALLISISLLLYFKSLRCARILIHINLFCSFALTNGLWLLWYYLMYHYPEILINNEPWCACLYSFISVACLTSNYTWMLCEGVYLHTVLVRAFVAQRRLVRALLIAGWGVPLVAAVAHALARATLGQGLELDMCWMNESRFDVVQQAVVAVVVLLNAAFLVNIVRVLVMKLRSGPARTAASSSTMQALRATLLLVPLLGLNFILTPFRPTSGYPWEHIYDVVSAVTASFQGLCVAVLFCFCNGEVQAQIKRKWPITSSRQRTSSSTATTMSQLNGTSTCQRTISMDDAEADALIAYHQNPRDF